MSKQEYLAELSRRLSVLPYNEQTDALEYYKGYLEDAEDEAAAITELGTPAEVAAKILAGVGGQTGSTAGTKSYGNTRHEGGNKGEAFYKRAFKNPDGTWDGFKLAMAIIIAIFALPMAFPVVAALAIIPLSLFIALCAVILSFGIAAVGLVLGGILGAIGAVFALFSDPPSALFMLGFSMITLGLGVLFIKLVARMARGFGGIAGLAAKKIRRATEPTTESEGE
jgi:uncharacterized membrane protein